jgi:hypothetical protein
MNHAIQTYPKLNKSATLEIKCKLQKDLVINQPGRPLRWVEIPELLTYSL